MLNKKHTQYYLIFTLLCTFFLFLSKKTYSQYENAKVIFSKSDTLKIDTLSLIPGKVMLKGIPKKDYLINHSKAEIYLHKPSLINKNITVNYNKLPFSLEKKYFHKPLSLINSKYENKNLPFSFSSNNKERTDILDFNGLSKSGSISRGISFGDVRSLAVNSTLNLEISGKMYNGIEVKASISDANIPIQTEGNTKLLNQFDRIFITLSKNNTVFTVGDVIAKSPINNKYINYIKKVQGGQLSIKKENKFSIEATGGISKGKFRRQKIIPIENNQVYSLNNRTQNNFIVILSGTEKVYVDGKLLNRGKNYDYVIDYNSAIITFTNNFLITKNQNIFIDFEYSDKNYTRTLISSSIGYKLNKTAVKIDYVAEEDLKNQPLQQDLNQKEKKLMNSLGDSIHKVLLPRFTKTEFNNNQILYRKKDTLGTKDVFIRVSRQGDDELFSVSFSKTEPNKGNYILKEVTAIGRIFVFVPPINGKPQGNYTPKILLITPKKSEMVGFSSSSLLSKNTTLNLQGAISNFDINRLSTIEKGNDFGYAYNMTLNKIIWLNQTKKDSFWHINLNFDFKEVSGNYKEFLPHRESQFTRKWNLDTYTFNTNQYEIKGEITIKPTIGQNFSYSFKSLRDLNSYNGNRHQLKVNILPFKSLSIEGYSDLTNTSGPINSSYLRNFYTVLKEFQHFSITTGINSENNVSRQKDSINLTKSSRLFTEYQAGISSGKKKKSNIAFNISYRSDYLPVKSNLERLSNATNYKLSINLKKYKNHLILASLTYRDFKLILDTSKTKLRSTNNALIRIDYISKWFKKAISSSILYQINSGKEQKKEFSYLSVTKGSGTHTYTGDNNKNGKKDFDEFNISQNPDQSDYIKVSLPTNEFTNVYSSSVTHNLFINPALLFSKNTSGLTNLISRFSNKTNLTISQKVSHNNNIFNPFHSYLESNIISTNNYIYNVLSFNKTNITFGVDLILSENRNKTLLTNGFESKNITKQEIVTRWNITREFLLKISGTYGTNLRNSIFERKNHLIKSQKINTIFTYQPSSKYRFSFITEVANKKNDPAFGSQNLNKKNLGVEARLSKPKIGTLTAKANWINLNYVSNNNNLTLDYEMLEGLKSGTNITWGIIFQQNISKNIQISLNYTGRKSQDSKTLHYGNMQLRAFF